MIHTTNVKGWLNHVPSIFMAQCLEMPELNGYKVSSRSIQLKKKWNQ